MQICLKERCPKAFGSFRRLTCSPWRYGLVQGPCAAYLSESRARYPCLGLPSPRMVARCTRPHEVQLRQLQAPGGECVESACVLQYAPTGSILFIVAGSFVYDLWSYTCPERCSS